MSSPSYLHWVQDKPSGEEHVTFESFVRHFNLTNKQLATEAYANLIQAQEIRLNRRERLKESFDEFLAHKQDLYWSERRLEVSSEIVANDAGVNIQEVGGITSRDGFSQMLSMKRARSRKQPIQEFHLERQGEDSGSNLTCIDRSFEGQIGKDDLTLSRRWDFKSVPVDNNGEPDRDQEAEAEESEDDVNDGLGQIILPHDFHGLFEALYRAANNQGFTLPKMPKIESSLKRTLFQYVSNHLTVYHDLPRVQQKDFVAASSVVYLHCTNAETIFKSHDIPNLLEKTMEPEMAIPSTTLSDLLKTLKDQAQDDQGNFDVRQFVDLVDIEKGSLAAKRRQDPIHRPADTEQKSQAVWERVFNTLFAKTIVTAVIGETGLEGSGEARTQNEADYAVEQPKRKKQCPRKLDCKFAVSIERMKKWEFITISNSEMKALRSTEEEISVMSPLTTAYSASLMSLYEQNGVHVCGKALDHDLLIPTNALELECFMDGRTLTALFSLRVGRELSLQMLNSGSRGPAPTSVNMKVRTFYTPTQNKSIPFRKMPPSPSLRPSLRKHRMDHSSSSSPQMKESRKRR
ncbi:hypothetical protein BGZ76_003915 [Entomortierella beljakovae]|nr:hypothetical protein BGZ76_003915 [Entomortierella beljakovae]